jgi:heme exporter protein B
MHELRALLARDLGLMWQKRSDAAQPMLFALMVCVMFPLAMGSEPARLEQSASAVIWVAHLLAGMLVLDNLYRSDFEDGSLEQLLLAPVPLPMVIASKVAVHWLTTALPLLVLTPLLAQLLFLPMSLLPVLMLSLLIGSLLMSLIGAVVAALTLGIRRSGLLLALMALPMYVPVLVFGAGSVWSAGQGLPWLGAIYLMCAGLVLLIVLAPWAAASAPIMPAAPAPNTTKSASSLLIFTPGFNRPHRYHAKPVVCRRAMAHQPKVAPERRMMGSHLADSSRMSWANFSGVPPAGSKPAACRRWRTDSSCKAWLMAALMRSTKGLGVAAATSTPFQAMASKPFKLGTPLSVTVGTSGVRP